MVHKTSNIQNVFGSGDLFIGDFILKGSLRLDGSLKGRVITDTKIYISRTGFGIGILKANVIDIRGVFKGDLFASNLVIIRSSGFVSGRIYSSFLEVEEGGNFSGSCSISVLTSKHDLVSYVIEEKKENLFKLDY